MSHVDQGSRVDQEGVMLLRNVAGRSGRSRVAQESHVLFRKVTCGSGKSRAAQESHVLLRKVLLRNATGGR
jgi:hypothetical protein